MRVLTNLDLTKEVRFRPDKAFVEIEYEIILDVCTHYNGIGNSASNCKRKLRPDLDKTKIKNKIDSNKVYVPMGEKLKRPLH